MVDLLVDTVGGKQVTITHLDRQAVVIDFNSKIGPHRSIKKSLFATYPTLMVTGEALQLTLTVAVNAGVTNVKNMGGS